MDELIPKRITKRPISVELKEQCRFIENEELILLSMLDSDGKLSQSTRLIEFMLFMTRLLKLEHRVLCLHVLSTCISESLELEFVSNGGLRILKRWIKTAELDGNVEELRLLVKICKKLPFMTQSIKATDIGKTIKKLLKFKVVSDISEPSVESATLQLHNEVRQLMTYWTEQANQAAAVAAAASAASRAAMILSTPTSNESKMDVDCDEVVIVPGSVESRHKHPPVLIDVRQQHIISQQSKAVEPSVVSLEATGSSEARNSLPFDIQSATVTSTAPSVAATITPILFPKLNIIRSADTPVVSVTTSQFPSASSLLPMKSAIAGVARSSRKATDMAEGARKLLAMRANAVQATTEGNGSKNGDTSKSRESTENVLPVVRRGGLKKPGAPKRDIPLTIQWADDKGGILREVHTIEVEKIKSSTASYKSHRDLVKKERQLEKETHLSKAQDAMHKNTEWRTPSRLKLSVEVLENSDNPVVSSEKDVQAKRLSHVLEIRYLDDSLIPPDPDETLAASTLSTDEYVTSSTIPWYQPGTEPVFSAPSVTMLHDNSINNGYREQHHQQQQQQQYGSHSGRGGLGDDFVSSNVFGIGNLPLSLQRLDPLILEQILLDRSLLQSLLMADGSVDEYKLSLFLSQLAVRSGGGGGNVHDNNRFMSSNTSSIVAGAAAVVDPLNMMITAGGRYDSAAGTSGGFFTENNRVLSSNGGGGGSGGGSFNYNSNISNNRSRASQQQQWDGGVDDMHGDFSDAYHGNNSNDNYRGGGGGERFAGQSHVQSVNAPSRFNAVNRNQNSLWSGTGGGGGVNAMMASVNKPSSRTTGAAAKQFTGTKASTPCRFFATSKGCQFGDKCQFGHFASSASTQSYGSVNSDSMHMDEDQNPAMAVGNTRWGGGATAGPGGVNGFMRRGPDGGQQQRLRR